MFTYDDQLDHIRSVMSEMIRVGRVTSTDDTAGTARVQFQDRNGLVSFNLRVVVRNSLQNKDYWMPDINEQVLCLFMPIGIENGWIIGSFYSDVTTAPASTKDKRRTTFEDGTTVEYDRDSHTLTVDIPESGGNVVVNAHTKVTVNSPKIDLGEPASLEPSVLGDKLAEWITGQLKPWLDNHQHIGNLGQPTSAAMTAPLGPFEEGAGAQGGAVYSQKNRNQ